MKPYYEEGTIQLFLGDCREVMPQLERVDHVITDPPYSEYVHSKSRRGGTDAPPLDGRGRRMAASFNRTKEFGFEALTPELRSVCATAFATLGRRWVLVFSDVESTHLWRADLVAAGLEYVRTGAWVKHGGTPQFTGDRPATGFEAITIAHPKGRKRWNGGGTAGVWQHAVVQNRGAGEDDVRLHTTQKPYALMTELVSLFTDPGETILDPFCGSGTTLRAAKDLGRRALGIEISEAYCSIAVRRLRQEVLPLDEVRP